MNSQRVDRFHRAFYVNMAAAAACLAYGDWPFLSEMPIVALVVGSLMLAAFIFEGRWALSLFASNIVGVLILAAAVGWVSYHYFRSSPVPIDNLPWPTSLLPYLGPPLLILMAAILHRPKLSRDYWQLIGLGLIAVALGCALAGDALFGLFLLIYGISLVVCLHCFFRAEVPALPTVDGRSVDSWRPKSLGWTIATLTAAVTGFLLTPRFTDAQWEIGHIGGRLRTGLAARDPGIDLNVRGNLKVDNEVAFEILAERADGTPKLDLSPTQRWRGPTFSLYERGRWGNRYSGGSGDRTNNQVRGFDQTSKRSETSSLENQVIYPDLGPQKWYLTFQRPYKARQTPILAEPIWPGVDFAGLKRAILMLSPPAVSGAVQVLPILTFEPSWLRAPVTSLSDFGTTTQWAMSRDGDLFPTQVSGVQRRTRYRQVTAPMPEANLSLPVDLNQNQLRVFATRPDLPLLHQYTTNLLAQMVQSGRLEWNGQAGVDPLPARFHEATARMVRTHLATSGVFQYSLDLMAQDPSLDPIEDFVINVRKGHCNRFASALALMLRSQGIPTRIVLGYRGAESQGEGMYVVRNSDAHSWVEVAVRRADEDGKSHWHWLTLDPTPELERDPQTESGQLGRWIGGVQRGTSELFQSFVIDYDADKQQQTRELLGTLSPMELMGRVPLQHIPTVATLLALSIVGGLTAVSLSKQRYGKKPRNVRMLRFIDQARQRGFIKKDNSVTPREAVTEFASAVSNREDGVELAAAAHRLSEHYYANRYGTKASNANTSDDFHVLMSAIRPRWYSWRR